MSRQYVESRDDGHYIAGTRVSLDSVVYAFLRGESPDGIVESFPRLTLEQAYGAIAYYLAHQEAINSYLEQGRAEFARMREEPRRKHPALYAKLEAARRRVRVDETVLHGDSRSQLAHESRSWFTYPWAS